MEDYGKLQSDIVQLQSDMDFIKNQIQNLVSITHSLSRGQNGNNNNNNKNKNNIRHETTNAEISSSNLQKRQNIETHIRQQYKQPQIFKKDNSKKDTKEFNDLFWTFPDKPKDITAWELNDNKTPNEIYPLLSTTTSNLSKTTPHKLLKNPPPQENVLEHVTSVIQHNNNNCIIPENISSIIDCFEKELPIEHHIKHHTEPRWLHLNPYDQPAKKPDFKQLSDVDVGGTMLCLITLDS